MNNLRENGSASVAELKEFMNRMKGRTPREMLGVVSQSGLVRSTLVATLGVGVVLVLFTVGPYVWAKQSNEVSRVEQLTSEREQLQKRLDKLNSLLAAHDRENETRQSPEPQPIGSNAEQEKSSGQTQQKNMQKAAEAMGDTGVKTAPPASNPLENELDNLLDDID